MTINYINVMRADIRFDDNFTYHGMNNTYHPLKKYIDKATFFMGEYNFVFAQIIDCETGKIIVEMSRENDCNNSSDEDVFE